MPQVKEEMQFQKKKKTSQEWMLHWRWQSNKRKYTLGRFLADSFMEAAFNWSLIMGWFSEEKESEAIRKETVLSLDIV